MRRPDPLDDGIALAVLELGMRPWGHASETVAGLCGILRARGVPLERLHLGFDLQHPLLRVGLIDWTPEAGARFDVVPLRGGEVREAQFEVSPIRAIRRRETDEVRLALRDPEQIRPFPLARGLAEAGFTDYVGVASDIGASTPAAMTFSTRRPGGFDPGDMAALRSAAWAFQTLARGLRWKALCETVVRTYIGPDTGPRVLDGAIHRGDVTRREAVVWFSDLRGFTQLSETAGALELVDVLNRVFGVVGEHVAREGGEILKFIGDAVLAIFPYDSEAGAVAACARAVRAATRCLDELGRADGPRIGIGLHRGELVYGNIGTPDRLDFTVIGRTVNLASRVEGLCGALGEAVLATAAVTDLVEGRWRSRGAHRLKGLAAPVEVFAPA
jgi:adenylate cyclase